MERVPKVKEHSVKYLIGLFLFTCVVSAQDSKKEAPAVWFKAGPDKMPRYFKKGSVLPLCGIFEDVAANPSADNSAKTTKSINIESCLQAKDNIEGVVPAYFEIVDLKDGKMHILNPEGDKKIYYVNANEVVTYWAKRFPEGEVMLGGYDLCARMSSWRQKDNAELVSQNPNRKPVGLPFAATSVGESIRYHVFEYHLGCGT